MLKDEEKIAFFREELNLIETPRVRTFAEELLKGTGDWFYHEPASTSGKYHPMFALGNGGLMRHTKAVVMFLSDFLRSKVVTKTKVGEDLLIMAAIAHDIRKHDPNTGEYLKDHAARAVAYVKETRDKHPELISMQECDFVCSAIASHMGVWDHEKLGTPMPQTISQIALSFADIAASRRYINIDFSFMPYLCEYVKENPTTNNITENGK